MSIVVQILDKMIASAESLDSKLHSSLDYLKELRQKLTSFGAAELDGDEDRLCGALRAIAMSADAAE